MRLSGAIRRSTVIVSVDVIVVSAPVKLARAIRVIAGMFSMVRPPSGRCVTSEPSVFDTFRLTETTSKFWPDVAGD